MPVMTSYETHTAIVDKVAVVLPNTYLLSFRGLIFGLSVARTSDPASFGHTTTANWNFKAMAPASSSLSIPNVLSSDFNTLAEYDTRMSEPYGAETYRHPTSSQTTSLGVQPHSLASASSRSSPQSSSREPFHYSRRQQRPDH
ncbi:hypothetical protein C8034_v011190 [Colletotrichum sidae]|uniref:Uncharacterized protein n=1 Tax=Colletotrichum sidae TaxID=1347389 RepID=A0A4R8T108_9PEZI|nr:hypothetical protein C8034_v011190 [Colletotrichum sidae]